MRRLILFRHAKAEAAEPGGRDIERPLAARGRAAAPAMGRWLAAEGLAPDLAAVSPSKRTRETWALARSAFAAPPREEIEPRIYEASVGMLLAALRETAPEIGTLLLVGHNPGLQDLASVLVADGEPAALALFHRKFPTAAVAVLEIDAPSWQGIGRGSARLARFVTPAALGVDGE